MKSLLIVIAATLAVLVGLPGGAQAATHDAGARTFQTTSRTHQVADLDIVAVHRLPAGRLAVAFNDGSSYDVRACRYEDGHRCWWDARNVGNRKGTGFIALRNRLWTITR